jgi:hypothetical protein
VSCSGKCGNEEPVKGQRAKTVETDAGSTGDDFTEHSALLRTTETNFFLTSDAITSRPRPALQLPTKSSHMPVTRHGHRTQVHISDRVFVICDKTAYASGNVIGHGS